MSSPIGTTHGKLPFVVWVLAAGTFVLVARVVTALATGAFWAVGFVIATTAAGPRNSTRAVSVMMVGLTLANVVGVPIGSLAGQVAGWRGPFWAWPSWPAWPPCSSAGSSPRSSSVLRCRYGPRSVPCGRADCGWPWPPPC
jgi:MFS family permease